MVTSQAQKLELHTKQNKYNHVKVLLRGFHLNGHIIGFHPQTQELEYILNKISCESTAEAVSFEWLHDMISSADSKVRTTYKTNSTIGESTAEEVSFKWYHRRISSTELAVRPSKTRLYNGCRSELCCCGYRSFRFDTKSSRYKFIQLRCK